MLLMLLTDDPFSGIPLPVWTAAYVLAVSEDRNLNIPANHCVQSSNTITARPLGCNLLGKEERGFLLCPNPHSWARLPNRTVCVLWRHSNLGFARVPPFQEYYNNTTTWHERSNFNRMLLVTYSTMAHIQQSGTEARTDLSAVHDIWAIPRLIHKTAVRQQNKQGREGLVNRLLLWGNKMLPSSTYE